MSRAMRPSDVADHRVMRASPSPNSRHMRHPGVAVRKCSTRWSLPRLPRAVPCRGTGRLGLAVTAGAGVSRARRAAGRSARRRSSASRRLRVLLAVQHRQHCRPGVGSASATRTRREPGSGSHTRACRWRRPPGVRAGGLLDGGRATPSAPACRDCCRCDRRRSWLNTSRTTSAVIAGCRG